MAHCYERLAKQLAKLATPRFATTDGFECLLADLFFSHLGREVTPEPFQAKLLEEPHPITERSFFRQSLVFPPYELPVLLRHQLLRQSHSFEGL